MLTSLIVNNNTTQIWPEHSHNTIITTMIASRKRQGLMLSLTHIYWGSQEKPATRARKVLIILDMQ